MSTAVKITDGNGEYQNHFAVGITSSDIVIIKLLLLPCYSNFPLSLKASVKSSVADGRKSSKLIEGKSPGPNIQKIREMVFLCELFVSLTLAVTALRSSKR